MRHHDNRYNIYVAGAKNESDNHTQQAREASGVVQWQNGWSPSFLRQTLNRWNGGTYTRQSKSCPPHRWRTRLSRRFAPRKQSISAVIKSTMRTEPMVTFQNMLFPVDFSPSCACTSMRRPVLLKSPKAGKSCSSRTLEKHPVPGSCLTGAFLVTRWSRWARRELIRQRTSGALATDDSWGYKKGTSPCYRPMAQSHCGSSGWDVRRVNNSIPLPGIQTPFRPIRY